MSLKYALLGQLAKRSMTGYELKQFFDQAIAHFWQADHTQIYRTLNALESENLIVSTTEIQETRPNRKPYTITSLGRQALAEWLYSEQAMTSYRDAFLIQLFFAESLEASTLIRLLTHQLDQHRARLSTLQATQALIDRTATTEAEARLETMTLALGLSIEQTYIEWLVRSIEQLEPNE
jgi:DNA-binding PadR family transcriptional regulator